MNHGAVVAPAESLADGDELHVRQFAAKIHRDLARERDARRAVARFQLGFGNLVVFGDASLDGFGIEAPRAVFDDEALQKLLDRFERQRVRAADADEGRQRVHRAFEVAHAVRNVFGNVFEYAGKARGVEAAVRRLLPQNGQARLERRELNVGGKPALKAGNEAVFEPGNVAGGTIAREHDLSAARDQLVERVKERFLRLRFSREKLDVVDEQHVRFAVAAVKLELVFLAQHRVQEVVRESFAGHVDDFVGRQPLRPSVVEHFVRDRVHQVRLAHARRPEEENRVERRFLRVHRDVHRRAERHFVLRADDEILERVAAVDQRRAGAVVRRRGNGRRADGGRKKRGIPFRRRSRGGRVLVFRADDAELHFPPRRREKRFFDVAHVVVIEPNCIKIRRRHERQRLVAVLANVNIFKAAFEFRTGHMAVAPQLFASGHPDFMMIHRQKRHKKFKTQGVIHTRFSAQKQTAQAASTKGSAGKTALGTRATAFPRAGRNPPRTR